MQGGSVLSAHWGDYLYKAERPGGGCSYQCPGSTKCMRSEHQSDMKATSNLQILCLYDRMKMHETEHGTMDMID